MLRGKFKKNAQIWPLPQILFTILLAKTRFYENVFRKRL